MPRPFEWRTYRAFHKSRGVNLRMDPSMLGPMDFQKAVNADFSTGTLAATLDVGPVIGSFGSSIVWFWPVGKSFISSQSSAYAMNDGNLVYVAQASKKVQVYDPSGTASDLGIAPLDSIGLGLSSGGTLVGTYSYKFTYVVSQLDPTGEPYQSNGQAFDLTFTFVSGGISEVTFGDFWPSDPRVVTVNIWRAEVTSGVTGYYYLLDAINTRTTTLFTDSGSTTPSSVILTWDYGGFPADATFTSDHSPAPTLTGLADRIQAQAQGNTGAVAGLGMIFGWQGNVLRWCKLEAPWYWPLANAFYFDRLIESVIAYDGQTVVFTSAATYGVFGSSDDAQAVNQLDSFHPIRSGWGKSTVRTPFGTFFVAKAGLALFDGHSSDIISREVLPSSYFDGLTCYGAAFYNDIYYLFHSSGFLRLDLRDGLSSFRLTTSTDVILSAVLAQWIVPIVAQPVQWFPLPAAVPAGASQGAGGAGTFGVRMLGVCSDNAGTLYTAGGTYLQFANASPFGDYAEIALPKSYAIQAAGSSPNLDWSDNSGSGATAYSPLGTYGLYGAPLAFLAVNTTYPKGALLQFGGCTNPNFQASGQTGGVAASLWICDLNVSGGSWASISPAGITGVFRHASCTDTTGADNLDFRFNGGQDNALAIQSATVQYTASSSSGSWTTLATTGPAPTLYGHGMIYLPGSALAAGFDVNTSIAAAITAGTQTVTPGSMINIVKGAELYIDSGANQELVTVTAVTSTTFTAVFAKNHATNTIAFASYPRLFVFGGVNTSSVASDAVYCLNLTTLGWTEDNTGASGAGVPARYYHVMAFNSTTNKIFIHGGYSTAGDILSDLWCFDPVLWLSNVASGSSLSAPWISNTDFVVNTEERTQHGGAFIGETLYLVGGSSNSNLFEASVWSVEVQGLETQGLVEGIHVAKSGDIGGGGGQNIRILEAGSALTATVQTGDLVGTDNLAIKTFNELRIDYIGDITINAVGDNGVSQQLAIFSSAVRTQVRQPLPLVTIGANYPAAGRHVSLEVVVAPNGATAGVVYRLDVGMSQDPGAIS